MSTPKTCTIPDCTRKHCARGFCQYHHAKALARGDIKKIRFVGPKRKTPPKLATLPVNASVDPLTLKIQALEADLTQLRAARDILARK